MKVTVCIGSSCHIKGSRQIVEQLQYLIAENKLKDKVTLDGTFCMGRCNREGVTVKVDDEVITGVTPEKIDMFFNEHILNSLK